MFLSGSIAGRKSVPFGNRVQTRRLIVIPFHAKIQGSKDIKNYTQHLVDQAGSAVLSWLIEGARKVITANYQINRPQCVLDAIGSYREGNDWLGNFINECCEVDKSYQAKSGDLYCSRGL